MQSCTLFLNLNITVKVYIFNLCPYGVFLSLQVNGLVCVVPMPARAYLVTDLEREMLEVDHGTLSAVSLKTRKPKYSKGEFIHHESFPM